MKKVLLIEDDREMCALLKHHLGSINIDTDEAHDGKAGLALAERNAYPLIVLDLNLPDKDGLEICRHLRVHKPHQFIAIVTSRSDDLDRVLGLEMGADDYICKPFNVKEMTARIKALLRRATNMTPAQAEVLTVSNICVDQSARFVTKGGKEVSLTSTEYDLLTFLLQNRGRTFSRQQLLNQVWGYEFSGYDHTVNSHINRLRAKIEKDPARPTLIETVWGVGYRIVHE